MVIEKPLYLKHANVRQSFKNVAQKPCSSPLYDIQMEFVKSGFFLGGPVPEPKHQDRDTYSIVQPSKYQKRFQQVIETVKFGAGEVLKNLFL